MNELDRILDRLGLELSDADRKAWEAILARPDVSRHSVLRRLGRWDESRRLKISKDRPSNMREVLQYLLAVELAEREALRPTGWLYENEWGGNDDDLGLCLACGRRREIVEVEVEWNGEDHTFREAPDPCLGLLPGVVYACCGHGRSTGCYVAGPGAPGGLQGPAAARWMRDHGGRPPRESFMLDPIGRAGEPPA